MRGPRIQTLDDPGADVPPLRRGKTAHVVFDGPAHDPPTGVHHVELSLSRLWYVSNGGMHDHERLPPADSEFA
jgi:hypothetical protein